MANLDRAAATPGPGSGWWPSKYGAGDQAGALNEITSGKVLEAVRLVREGRVYDLAHVLHQDIPAFPGRTFRQHLTTNYHQINRRGPGAGPAGLGRNSVNWIVEQVTRPSRWAPTWTVSTLEYAARRQTPGIGQ
jgi:hypothetical protein